MKQVYTLGFSPCPNDTFIFDALVNHEIDTEGFEFEVVLEDVQTLNEWAKQGKLDITKISYGVLPLLLESYSVLTSGGALGKGVGPLLISNQPSPAIGEIAENIEQLTDFVNGSTVALPGVNTTANFLFSRAFPAAENKQFIRFDGIENFVLQEKGLGVIIHENRFTYQDKGLHKLVDLGEFWENATGFPIPLGGVVIKKTVENEAQQKIDRLIKQSIQYSIDRYPFLSDYVQSHSQEMSEAVMRQHIDLYVNEFSLNMGSSGRSSVLKLLSTLSDNELKEEEIFVEN